MRPSGPAPPKRAWVLPTAPGPTLRQRIERREREAGLRCDDVSCGLGPSDEDPLSEDVADTIKKVHQLTIRSKDMGENGLRTSLCEHKFHSSCLVSAARVALRDADAVVNDDGSVDVSCPVCRHEGCMMHGEWDDGVKALE
ncbi:hypothetical protein CPB83DRAFT_768282 [Crepidotus variabilis]|uniref:Uncharacterized protein n=1 Tax=Crepidotus variabilis TaxID=179855 RepID=A0A9P6EEB3_9AGAR|nr:hypothetical protein CPB83DRAFT_768282 [Crepidotus variabilis]